MEPSRIALFGATLITCALLPSCGIDASGNSAASQYEPYNSPARVNRLNNGNFLVTINSKVISFDASGRPMSTGAASPSEVYHAQEAVNDYMRGHRGDHMHPNYAYQSQQAPEVRPRGDGKLEVLMPQGGVVLYDANGRMIQKGGTVSGSQLYDANKAVQSYIRENNSSRGYDDV
jgi:hypothetical protein